MLFEKAFEKDINCQQHFRDTISTEDIGAYVARDETDSDDARQRRKLHEEMRDFYGEPEEP